LIEIHEPWIEFSAHEADFERNDGSVEKSPAILDKIKGKLAKSGLSTSALTMFSTCSLKYFYAQILGMRKEKQLEDELGADVFGTWVHKVLEIVDQEVVENYDGVYDRVNLAEVVSGLDGYLEKAMKTIQEKEGVFELEKGFNFVLKEVAKTLLESYYSKSDFSKNTKIIDLESTLTTNLKVVWGQEHLDVKVTGRIDRLDILDNREIRIIDYKTGKVERSELKSGELGLRNSILSGELKPKILQLWLYKFLLASELVHVSEKNEQVLLMRLPIAGGSQWQKRSLNGRNHTLTSVRSVTLTTVRQLLLLRSPSSCRRNSVDKDLLTTKSISHQKKKLVVSQSPRHT
jgi:hypothetical protein